MQAATPERAPLIVATPISSKHDQNHMLSTRAALPCGRLATKSSYLPAGVTPSGLHAN
jgi:hypothetical protein